MVEPRGSEKVRRPPSVHRQTVLSSFSSPLALRFGIFCICFAVLLFSRLTLQQYIYPLPVSRLSGYTLHAFLQRDRN